MITLNSAWRAASPQIEPYCRYSSDGLSPLMVHGALRREELQYLLDRNIDAYKVRPADVTHVSVGSLDI